MSIIKEFSDVISSLTDDTLDSIESIIKQERYRRELIKIRDQLVDCYDGKLEFIVNRHRLINEGKVIYDEQGEPEWPEELTELNFRFPGKSWVRMSVLFEPIDNGEIEITFSDKKISSVFGKSIKESILNEVNSWKIEQFQEQLPTTFSKDDLANLICEIVQNCFLEFDVELEV